MADNRRDLTEVDPELRAFLKRAMQNKLTPAESQSASIASGYAAKYPDSIYGNQFAVIRLECSNGTALGSGVFPKAILDKGIGKACDGPLVVSADETRENLATLGPRDPKHLLAPFLEKAMAAGTISLGDANDPKKREAQIAAAYKMAGDIGGIAFVNDSAVPQRCVSAKSCEPVVPGKQYTRSQLLITKNLGLDAAFTAVVLSPILDKTSHRLDSIPSMTLYHEEVRDCRLDTPKSLTADCTIHGSGLGNYYNHTRR